MWYYAYANKVYASVTVASLRRSPFGAASATPPSSAAAAAAAVNVRSFLPVSQIYQAPRLGAFQGISHG